MYYYNLLKGVEVNLNQKVVVITGALGTLGRAMSSTAVAAGATVVGVDCVSGEPEAGVAACHVIDLLDSTKTKAGFAEIAQAHGKIDAIVNIAGGFVWETLEDGSIDSWDRMYQLNVRTAANACQATLPHFPKKWRPCREYQCGRGGEGGHGYGGLRGIQVWRSPLDRGARGGAEGEKHHGECGDAKRYRHCAQSCGYARCGLLCLGEPQGPGRGDSVPVK